MVPFGAELPRELRREQIAHTVQKGTDSRIDSYSGFFDNARFFSLLAASHGFSRIRAFLTYEDAMEWLMAGDDA